MDTNSNFPTKLDEIVVGSEQDNELFFLLKKRPVVSGENLTNAQPSFDENGLPAVSFNFNPSAALKFGNYTKENIGSPFAIVLDDVVISAPTIRSHMPGGSGIITGNFSVDESNRLAILLRSGALPAEIEVLELRTIGPELGRDSINAGKTCCCSWWRSSASFYVVKLRPLWHFCKYCSYPEYYLGYGATFNSWSYLNFTGNSWDSFNNWYGSGC